MESVKLEPLEVEIRDCKTGEIINIVSDPDPREHYCKCYNSLAEGHSYAVPRATQSRPESITEEEQTT